MLSISRFSEDKEGILKGLKKRKFDNIEIIDKIIDLDISRKKLQQDLDQILFESNRISKEISEIFKSNKSDKNVDDLKMKSSTLKSKSKEISEKLDSVKKDIHTHLTTIPNIPENEVPDAKPSTPIQVMGIGGINHIGDIVEVVNNEKEARKMIQKRSRSSQKQKSKNTWEF